MRLVDSHVHICNSSPEAVESVLDELAAFGVSDVALQSISTSPKYDRIQNLSVLWWKSKYKKMRLGAFGCLHELDLYSSVPYEKQAESLLSLGCDGMKFLHMKPDLRKMIGKGLDDKSYDGVFAMLEEREIPITIHSGDPETFWDIDKIPPALIKRGWFYGDGSYLSREEHYNEIFRLLDKHPRLKVTLAHFFFLSNFIDEAERVLDTYPNVCFDLTPGWEMYVGFSRDIDAWRDFFIRYSDRILYGTDSNSDKKDNAKLHELVLSALKHDRSEFSMPCFGGPIIKGLDLPCDVIDKICYKNYDRLVASPKQVDIDGVYSAAERMLFDLRSYPDEAASTVWLNEFLTTNIYKKG